MNQFVPVGMTKIDQGRTSLRDLLIVFSRRRWIVLGFAVPIIAFGIFGTISTTDTYTASAQVLIQARNLENPSFRPEVVEYDILMSTATQVAQSIPVAQKAAVTVMDSLPELQAEDPKLANISSLTDLRDLILRHISCGQVGESNILSINFTHHNSKLALLVVGAVSKAYKEYSIESKQNIKAVDYYTEQIELLQAEIDGLMQQRVEIYNKAGMKAFSANNSAGIQQMRHLEYSYHQAKSLREGLEEQYRNLVAAIAADPDYVPSTGSTEKTTILNARIELDKAIRDLGQLELTYNETSPNVTKQKEFVAKSRKIFSSERNGVVTDLKIQREIARSKEASLVESLDSYRQDLIAYPEIERKVFSIDLRVSTQKDLLKALEIKRGEVRLKAEGDQRISGITPLNMPTVGFNIGSGKKFIYLIFASIIGIVLGLVVALLVDAQDHRVFDRRQAEDMFDVPVLGAISPTNLSSGKS